MQERRRKKNRIVVWWVKGFLCKSESMVLCEKITQDKTGVVNDPLGQTHSPGAVKICFVLPDFGTWERTDGRTICVNII